MLNKIIEEKLKLIYGTEYKDEYTKKLFGAVNNFDDITNVKKPDHKNTYLITYGDIVQKDGEKTLDTLHRFVNQHFKKCITDIHLLPMFEYTSDDGFSVVDYLKVDPKLGDWKNLNELANDYRLMYDFVANHISQKSEWFQGYLNGDPKYADYFIPKNENFDYSKTVRPRTSPLISEYKNGKTAWTTFSEDQVDLNYRNIDVLVRTTEILLEYAKNGASSIRLDAIGFLWKESGTTSIHLPQTHEVVKLWRKIFDYKAKNVQIITETNVPHKENISYFGKDDEANQVYQFALPPLTLHTFLSGDSTKITNWAKGINRISDTATYFNFLASHDGIGMRPSEGILTDEDRENIFKHVKNNGGRFNMKSNPDGSESVYEMNVTYYDALKTGDDEDENINKFIAAHGILLSMVGVPAIYYNSLIGSTNYYEGVETSGINRRINRQKFPEEQINQEIISNPRRNKIVNKMNEIIKVRASEPLFDPYNEQEVLNVSSDVFVIKRKKNNDEITCIINVTNKPLELSIDIKGTNILNNKDFSGKIKPYEILWIK